jgi:hypothetical protein
MIAGITMIAYFGYFGRPAIKVVPNDVAFYQWGENYSFRLENDTDEDAFSAAFIFRAESEGFDTNDFTIQVPQSSLKPLSQQSGPYVEFADIQGVIGLDKKRRVVILVFVEHLKPKEQRDIVITLVKPASYSGINLLGPLEMTANKMSYYRKALPLSKQGSVVFFPVFMSVRRLVIDHAFDCFKRDDSQPSCDLHPIRQGQVHVPVGQYYFGVTSSGG